MRRKGLCVTIAMFAAAVPGRACSGRTRTTHLNLYSRVQWAILRGVMPSLLQSASYLKQSKSFVVNFGSAFFHV